MTVFLLYGRDSEYSLGPLQSHLLEAGYEVISARNWAKSDFSEQLNSQFHFESTILLSSAHPGINERTGRLNIPIADLKRMGPWKKIGFFPHDLIEPFRWEERSYLNDYDFFVHEFPIPPWIHSYLLTIKVSGLVRNKIHLGLQNEYLFLPDRFWSFGAGTAQEFLKRFPIARDPRVVTKFANISKAHALTASLRDNYGINILNPSLPGFELITPANGILLTQGLSSVVSEAKFSDMKCIFILEQDVSNWEKQKLRRNYPAIIDFHKVGIPLPSNVNNKAIGPEKKAQLDIREFLNFCIS